MNQYDVYHQWLGIPADQQPPTLYRLLGLADFEDDPEVIRNAAERQALHVRRLARGEFTDIGQELLNEVAQAKLCLISADKRAEYNLSLRESQDCRQTVKEVGPASVDATYIQIERTRDGQPRKDRYVVGYHKDCDFRIEWKTVSGIHCQLTLHGSSLYVSDLNSTNGTFVNNQRIRDRIEIEAIDLLTLGRDHRVILPRDLLGGHDDSKYAIFVGRSPGNEVQIDSKRASLFHARLVVDHGTVTIEDLKSKSGVILTDQQGQAKQIRRCKLANPDDNIRFGDASYRAGDLIELARQHRSG